MKKVSIIGATGYTGRELISILLKHPKVTITHVTSESSSGISISEMHPRFRGRIDLVLEKYNWDAIKDTTDIVFLALPHGTGMNFVDSMLKDGKIVIDFSSDFRIKDPQVYTKWYKLDHTAKQYLENAVYGLPELFREEIKKSTLIANPGCYATAIIMGLFPLVKNEMIDFDSIIVDAKSGVSGAGKKLDAMYLFNEANENLTPYSVGKHRHTPEIEQVFSSVVNSSFNITFVPHLVPMTRGIIATMYATPKRGVDIKDVRDAYNLQYGNEYFVRVLQEGTFPSVKNVAYTNYCDIGLTYVESTGKIIVVSAIDNLMKGASGQAVQNMNILCGFNEEDGV